MSEPQETSEITSEDLQKYIAQVMREFLERERAEILKTAIARMKADQDAKGR